MNNKVVIIGCGNVGMSYAYALLNQDSFVNELVLIDINVTRIEGEVLDLNHCLSMTNHRIKIKVGTYEDCSSASLIVIATGANQKVGETRMDLVKKNSKIFKDIIKNVMKNNFKGIFLVATNPLDVMTYLTFKYSGLPASRVIGTGTHLDTSRLKYIIGDKLNINPKCINGYVIGEHGDTEFIPWSNVNIGLQNIKDFLGKKEFKKIEDDVRNSAYEIINKKGATYYAIGMSLVTITNAILGDEHKVMVVSNYDKTNDVYISLPAIVGKKGIIKKIYFNLNEEETKKLLYSIKAIKKGIKNT